MVIGQSLQNLTQHDGRRLEALDWARVEAVHIASLASTLSSRRLAESQLPHEPDDSFIVALGSIHHNKLVFISNI